MQVGRPLSDLTDADYVACTGSTGTACTAQHQCISKVPLGSWFPLGLDGYHENRVGRGMRQISVSQVEVPSGCRRHASLAADGVRRCCIQRRGSYGDSQGQGVAGSVGIETVSSDLVI